VLGLAHPELLQVPVPQGVGETLGLPELLCEVLCVLDPHKEGGRDAEAATVAETHALALAVEERQSVGVWLGVAANEADVLALGETDVQKLRDAEGCREGVPEGEGLTLPEGEGSVEGKPNGVGVVHGEGVDVGEMEVNVEGAGEGDGGLGLGDTLEHPLGLPLLATLRLGVAETQDEAERQIVCERVGDAVVEEHTEGGTVEDAQRVAAGEVLMLVVPHREEVGEVDKDAATEEVRDPLGEVTALGEA